MCRANSHLFNLFCASFRLRLLLEETTDLTSVPSAKFQVELHSTSFCASLGLSWLGLSHGRRPCVVLEVYELSDLLWYQGHCLLHIILKQEIGRIKGFCVALVESDRNPYVHTLLVRLENCYLFRAVIFVDHLVDFEYVAFLHDLINVISVIFFCRFLKFIFGLLIILFLGCWPWVGHFQFVLHLGLLDQSDKKWSDVAELSTHDSFLDILVETIFYLVIVTSFDKARHFFPLATKLLV